MDPSWCPTSIPQPGTPLPLSRVLRGEFPCGLGTMRVCDSLRSSPSTRLPSRSDTTATLAFAPGAASVPAPGLELVSRCPTGLGPWKTQGLPSSRETPIATSPCSSTPVGRHAPNQSRTAAWPSVEEQRRLRHWDFRGSIAGLRSWLSTLRRAGYPNPTQDSLPGAGQALLGGLGHPQGFAGRFQSMTRPPSPSLLGAILFSSPSIASASDPRLEFADAWDRTSLAHEKHDDGSDDQAKQDA